MKIRWSPEASADFAEIVEYIRKEILPSPTEWHMTSTIESPR